jgi:hypothetical protein
MRSIGFAVTGVILLSCGLGGVFAGHSVHNWRSGIRNPTQEMRVLKDLYMAEAYDDLLKELNRIQYNPAYSTYEAKILYLRWFCTEHLSRQNEGQRVLEEFLAKYPNDPLGADMRLSLAYDELASSNYKDARNELESIVERFPASYAASRAKLRLSAFADLASSLPATNQVEP